MSNKEKENKYKDYLPENRIKNDSLEYLRKISALLICLIVLGIVGVIGIFFTTGRNIIEETLTVKSRNYNMNLGETISLTNIYKSPNVIWETTSDNIEINDNKVTALSEGNAYLIAVEDNKQVSDLSITVLPNDSNISIDNHDIIISSNEKVKINITQSSNKSKTIQESTTNNNNKTQKVEQDDNEEYNRENIEFYYDYDNYMNNNLIEEDRIQSNQSQANIEKEKIVEIEVKAPIEEKTSKKQEESIIYKSENPEIAKVDNDGNVIPISDGTTIITVTDESGNTDHTYVTVSTEPITLENETYIISTGAKVQVKYTLDTTKYKASDVKWVSTNPSIATVNSNGLITGVSAGNTTIKASVGNTTKIINVTIKETIINPTSIDLSKTAIDLNVGQVETVNAIIKPDNATNKIVTWKSSDTNIVSVDNNGKVTAKKSGNATITATTSNGISKNIIVTVNQIATSITLNVDKNNIKVGENATLTYKILPESTTNKNIKYSYDSTYLAIDSNGKVTGIKEGTTTITAISQSNTNIKSTITMIITSNNTNSSSSNTSSTITYKSGYKEIDQMVNWMLKIAKDDSHGYNSSASRRIFNPDIDCSSFVYYALTKPSGAELSTKSLGTSPFTTLNMPSKLKNTNFNEYDYKKSNLKYGDILWRRSNGKGHTEVYIGDGKTVGAHGCNPNKSHPKRSCNKGDQDGTEVSIVKASTNWMKIYRYKG